MVSPPMRSSSYHDQQKSERCEVTGRGIPVNELEKLYAALLNHARNSLADFYMGALGARRDWSKFQCKSADAFVFGARIWDELLFVAEGRARGCENGESND